MFSVTLFVIVGVTTSRRKNLRLFIMTSATVPPFVGFLLMSLLPNEAQYKWVKWGGYFMTVPFVLALFLAWTLIPSNTAGRTKRTLTSSFTFVGYCVGNMTGSQIFKASDAPRYVPGTIACAACFAMEFVLLVVWRLVYVRRNRRRQRQWQQDGISEEERVAKAQELGEQDTTDFKNPYVSLDAKDMVLCCISTDALLVPVHTVIPRQGSHAPCVYLHIVPRLRESHCCGRGGLLDKFFHRVHMGYSTPRRSWIA